MDRAIFNTEEDRLQTKLRQANTAHAETAAALGDADRTQMLLVVLLERIVMEYRAGNVSEQAVAASEAALILLGFA
jgi:hypothetical protein